MTSRVPAIVDALVSAGLVDPARSEEARGVVTRSLGTPAKHETTSRALLVEIAGYVGGALVVASIGLFLMQQWADLSETVQVAVLAVIAVLLAGAGLTVSRVAGGYEEMRTGGDEVRRRLTSALLTGAALAAAFTAARFVDVALVDEGGYSDWPPLAGGLTMAVLALVGYRYATTLLGQLGMIGGLFVTATSAVSMLDVDVEYEAMTNGLTFMAIGLLWVVIAEAHALREVVPARAIGAAVLLFGAQTIRFEGNYNNLAYALMLAVAVAGLVMYMRTVSWPYLVIGVLGITLVVPEAIIDWTGDSLGPAGGVLVAGLTLLAASLAGFRLRQEATEEHRPEEHPTDGPRDPHLVG